MKLGQFKLDPVRLGPPLVFAALALGYLSRTKGFDDPTSAQAPSLYGGILFGLAALVLAVTVIRGFFPPAPTAEREEVSWKRAIGIYAAMGLLIAVIFAAGFYVAIPLFLFVFFFMIARLRLATSVIAAGLGFLFIWLVFSQFLHMPVFRGYWLPGLGL